MAALAAFGDAITSIGCLEWICPRVAATVFGDPHAACSVSSVCVAASAFGHATHEGIGASVSACDVLPEACVGLAEAEGDAAPSAAKPS